MLDLELLSEQAQAFLDEFIAAGSDDELFASGYLRGHIDLIIGTAIVNEQEVTKQEIVDGVVASIDKAIKSGELEQKDIEVVNQILNQWIASLDI